jgi:ABC-type polysaccharide/polyol phosphate export permease
MKSLGMIQAMVSYRELIKELATREIKARYKQSVLGYAWVMLSPLCQMIVMAFVFSTLLKVSITETTYPLFLYVGLLPWTLFTGSLQSSTGVLIENSSLIRKIYFPRELFILSTMLAKLVDFFLASTVFVIFFLLFRQQLHLSILFFFPILLIQFVFSYGLALILAASNLLYRDIQYVLNLLLLVWLYLTPVMYPPEIIPEQYHFLHQLNPMSQFITAYRQTILFGEIPSLTSVATMIITAVVTLGIGHLFFKRLEGIFADIV